VLPARVGGDVRVLPAPQGRDSQRNLQRSIAARKVRDGLPGLVAALVAHADEWAVQEGGPFMLDGRDLKASDLMSLWMPARRAQLQVAEIWKTKIAGSVVSCPWHKTTSTTAATDAWHTAKSGFAWQT